MEELNKILFKLAELNINAFISAMRALGKDHRYQLFTEACNCNDKNLSIAKNIYIAFKEEVMERLHEDDDVLFNEIFENLNFNTAEWIYNIDKKSKIDDDALEAFYNHCGHIATVCNATWILDTFNIDINRFDKLFRERINPNHHNLIMTVCSRGYKFSSHILDRKYISCNISVELYSELLKKGYVNLEAESETKESIMKKIAESIKKLI